MPDQPWIFRTYAGHSTPKASNELYLKNLAKGQTGLSIAFDLPTQTGYDFGPSARARRGRQGRGAGQPSRRHAGASARHPARQDEHVDDDQCDGGLAAFALYRVCRRAGRGPQARSPARCRTTSSRNIYRAAPMCSRRSPRCGSSRTSSSSPSAKSRNGTRRTSAPTICRRRARRPCRNWPTRSPPPSPCSTR